jgi:16S rRNA G966 N2-methylase RsmD
MQVLRRNLASLELETRASVIAGPALLSIGRFPAAIVFLDPPYTLDGELTAALELLSATPPQLVIAQHSVRVALPEALAALRRTRVVKQGDNALSFFSPE